MIDTCVDFPGLPVTDLDSSPWRNDDQKFLDVQSGRMTEGGCLCNNCTVSIVLICAFASSSVLPTLANTHMNRQVRGGRLIQVKLIMTTNLLLFVGYIHVCPGSNPNHVNDFARSDLQIFVEPD